MVKIIADSTCDLSPELVKQYDIRILPLFVRLGEEEYRDGIDITPDDLFAWSDRTKKTPTTAAPAMETIIRAYDEELQKADELVVFTIASGMSSSYTNCVTAVEACSDPQKVTVIDSANLSTGIGLMVLRAAGMAAAGCTAGEIREEMEQISGRVRASFVLDTLVFLHRGGRCSGTKLLAGNILQLHPRIGGLNAHRAQDWKRSTKNRPASTLRKDLWRIIMLR